MLKRFLQDEQGQDLIEYTLLLAFVCLATSALFVSSGGSLSGIWNAPTGYLRDLARDLKEAVPFQPWAKALYDERAAGLHWKDEPDANCLPQGVPKVLLAPAPWRKSKSQPSFAWVTWSAKSWV